mgnify:CR=1 FL=1
MRILRCRFCPFEAPFARKLASGEVRMGRDTLTWHVQEQHPIEYQRVRQFVREVSSTFPAREVEQDREDEGAGIGGTGTV